METQKSQVVDRLNQATNILVTVSSNPSVDQLSGAIGLTLALNKLGKHGTTVFSGAIPSAIDFLQPDKTIEKTTDSLRDFIISLDKSKADKLRYKVEDEMVKIFITPYLTPINEQDLEFSQGDFNVDVIVALGVRDQQDLDQAITAHGRILHDATLIGISTDATTALGSINWNDPDASSLSEMLSQLVVTLKADILDAQMATALMTGIVAETNRFSNEKTSAETMQVSAKLMAAGANQQLVASQLQPPAKEVNLQDQEASADLPPIENSDGTADIKEEASTYVDGTLQIAHEELKSLGLDSDVSTEADTDSEPDDKPSDQGSIEDQHNDALSSDDQQDSTEPEDEEEPNNSGFITEPPSRGGTLTAKDQADGFEPPTDILGSTERQGPILSHGTSPVVKDEPEVADEPEEDETVPLPEVQMEDQLATEVAATEPPAPDSADKPAEPEAPNPLPVPTLTPDKPQPQTLAELERAVSSAPDLSQIAPEPPAPDTNNGVDAARDAVSQAMSGTQPHIIEPVKALNAQPMDLNLGDIPAVNTSPASAFADMPTIIQPQAAQSDDVPSDPDVPPAVSQSQSEDNKNSSSQPGQGFNPNLPPPVPPPMMPPMPPPPGSDDPTVM